LDELSVIVTVLDEEKVDGHRRQPLPRHGGAGSFTSSQ
jgi:hypothetical protein